LRRVLEELRAAGGRAELELMQRRPGLDEALEHDLLAALRAVPRGLEVLVRVEEQALIEEDARDLDGRGRRREGFRLPQGLEVARRAVVEIGGLHPAPGRARRDRVRPV